MRARPLITLAGGGALALAAAGPAVAADPPSTEQGKRSETVAAVSWIEQDPDDSAGRPGNVHIGGLLIDSAFGNTDVFYGELGDWQCEPGRLPGDGEGCTLLAAYEIATAGVDLVLDPRSGTAHVTGSLAFYDFDGVADVFTMPVDLVWTADGKPVRTHDHSKYLSATTRSIFHLQTTTWSPVRVSGTVGTLVLGDEPGELNEQRLRQDEYRLFTWQRGSDEPPPDGGGQG